MLVILRNDIVSYECSCVLPDVVAVSKRDGIRRIALYGKGGIGKSTVAANLSVALSGMGYKVMQIGCDPKADSTRMLLHGKKMRTVLECMDSTDVPDIVVEGSGGTLCVECGGPRPGTGCAGRGIIVAFEMLEEMDAVAKYRPDVIIYDVLGDVVCGGFAMPIRNGYARDVFVVTSGESMSIYAAHNIATAVNDLRDQGYAHLGGIIQNSKGIEKEDSAVDYAAAEIGTGVVIRIPRSHTVQECESEGVTVMEGRPSSAQADVYRRLASEVLRMTETTSGGLRQK
jgi:nitrogenase iron protein NifH